MAPSHGISSTSGISREHVRLHHWSKYCAVQCGFHPGVFLTWAGCEIEVKGFKGAQHQAFCRRSETEKFVLG